MLSRQLLGTNVRNRLQNVCDKVRPLVVNVSTRNESHCSVAEAMQAAYDVAKHTLKSKKLPRDVNIRGVFACNELDLSEVRIYGFDYDYTLACYKPSMDYLLYNLGRERLIDKLKYPEKIRELEYKPGYAVRGLHFDVSRGLLLKLDSFLQIQFGSVYRGLTPLTDEEVLDIYKSRTIPLAYVESNRADVMGKMIQLADLFSVPEICLLCNVLDFFQRNHIEYDPEILFMDVKTAVQCCHPIMHRLVESNVSEYLESNPDIRQLFLRLKKDNKIVFLITNSPFHFVNIGMDLLVGNDWRQFFDLIIVQARKPRFFTDESRPIRLYDTDSGVHLWDRVTKVERGKIYCEGTLKQLDAITGWEGKRVLYFGDHPYTDLADVTLEHGWRTGAIVHELNHEIKTLNTETFKKNCNWLQILTSLIEDQQDHATDNESKALLEKWINERDAIRQTVKQVFNPQFGSVFRTFNNPTYFSRRLFRFADIYTSHVTNLLHYSSEHCFFPRRGVMPHELEAYGSYCDSNVVSLIKEADKAYSIDNLSADEERKKTRARLPLPRTQPDRQVPLSSDQIWHLGPTIFANPSSQIVKRCFNQYPPCHVD